MTKSVIRGMDTLLAFTTLSYRTLITPAPFDSFPVNLDKPGWEPPRPMNLAVKRYQVHGMPSGVARESTQARGRSSDA